MAKKEGPDVGEEMVLGSAAGGSRETSLPLLHHREMFWDLTEPNINDGWLLADDPAATLTAPSEVRQAVMLSRYPFYLCFYLDQVGQGLTGTLFAICFFYH